MPVRKKSRGKRRVGIGAPKMKKMTRLEKNRIVIDSIHRQWNINRVGLTGLKINDQATPVEAILPPFMNNCADVIIHDWMAAMILRSLGRHTLFIPKQSFVCLSSFEEGNTGAAYLYRDQKEKYHLYLINNVRENDVKSDKS